MRRKDKEIANQLEVEDLLTNALVGRLGTCFNNIPYITPVNYVYDNNKIYFHTALEGRKIDNINSNPNICFEIDEVKSIIPGINRPCASTTEYKSVIIFGNIKIVNDIKEKTLALNKLIEKYAPQSPKLSSESNAIRVTGVLVIDIKKITAKQSPAGRKIVIDNHSTFVYDGSISSVISEINTDIIVDSDSIGAIPLEQKNIIC